MKLTAEEQAARDALRARQGAGARYDAAQAPHDELLLARRATALFARKLNDLSDDALYAPSSVPGLTRAHVVAGVSYQARALTRLIEGVRSGVEQPMYPSPEARDAEIAHGATLPPRALRHLFDHSRVHLDVEWRDLEDSGWDRHVRLLDGSQMPVHQLPALRARLLSEAAAQLENKD
ncbi:maleylpyruvate isomerase [Lutimaribacter pacificus]|uniref:Maleylpyruvate isomerase n=1 Tax=Lutimaribacter pacificus TaxID=391948 RepID=A0A1H0M0Y0_9RHOB|nr:maleylpyruvate isomerase family mycothiol-dependent enzyme [Lutimaribacter pacificus]SDO74142.1 maleylpyruvate isomerase [Lutimaribacter pacificus]SHK76452.1 maleylpyruvate isomerase [Lutimaribacter pacificus]